MDDLAEIEGLLDREDVADLEDLRAKIEDGTITTSNSVRMLVSSLLERDIGFIGFKDFVNSHSAMALDEIIRFTTIDSSIEGADTELEASNELYTFDATHTVYDAEGKETSKIRINIASGKVTVTENEYAYELVSGKNTKTFESTEQRTYNITSGYLANILDDVKINAAVVDDPLDIKTLSADTINYLTEDELSYSLSLTRTFYDADANLTKKVNVSLKGEQVTISVSEYEYDEIMGKTRKISEYTEKSAWDITGSQAIVSNNIKARNINSLEGFNKSGLEYNTALYSLNATRTDYNADGNVSKKVNVVINGVAAKQTIYDYTYLKIAGRDKVVLQSTKNVAWDITGDQSDVSGHIKDALEISSAELEDFNTTGLSNGKYSLTFTQTLYDETDGKTISTVVIQVSDANEITVTRTDNVYIENTTTIRDVKKIVEVYKRDAAHTESDINSLLSEDRDSLEYTAESSFNENTNEIEVKNGGITIDDTRTIKGLLGVTTAELQTTTVDKNTYRYNRFRRLIYSAREHIKTDEDGDTLEQNYSREITAYTDRNHLAWTHKFTLEADGTRKESVSIYTEDIDCDGDVTQEEKDLITANIVTAGLYTPAGLNSGFDDKIAYANEITLNADGTRQQQESSYVYYAESSGANLRGKLQSQTTQTTRTYADGRLENEVRDVTNNTYNDKGQLTSATATHNWRVGDDAWQSVESVTTNTYLGNRLIESYSRQYNKLEAGLYNANDYVETYSTYENGEVKTTATLIRHYDDSWQATLTVNGTDGVNKFIKTYTIDHSGEIIQVKNVYSGKNGKLQKTITKEGSIAGLTRPANAQSIRENSTAITSAVYTKGYINITGNRFGDTKVDTESYYYNNGNNIGDIEHSDANLIYTDGKTDTYRGTRLTRSETIRNFKDSVITDIRVGLTLNEYDESGKLISSYGFTTDKRDNVIVTRTVGGDGNDIIGGGGTDSFVTTSIKFLTTDTAIKYNRNETDVNIKTDINGNIADLSIDEELRTCSEGSIAGSGNILNITIKQKNDVDIYEDMSDKYKDYFEKTTIFEDGLILFKMVNEYTTVNDFNVGVGGEARRDYWQGLLKYSEQWQYERERQLGEDTTRQASYSKTEKTYAIDTSRNKIVEASTDTLNKSYDLSGNYKETRTIKKNEASDIMHEWLIYTNSHNVLKRSDEYIRYYNSGGGWLTSEDLFSGVDIYYKSIYFLKSYEEGIIGAGSIATYSRPGATIVFIDNTFTESEDSHTASIRNRVHGTSDIGNIVFGSYYAPQQCRITPTGSGADNYYQDLGLTIPEEGLTAEIEGENVNVEALVDAELASKTQQGTLTAQQLSQTYGISISEGFSDLGLWLIDNVFRILPISMRDLVNSLNFVGQDQEHPTAVAETYDKDKINFFWSVRDLVMAKIYDALNKGLINSISDIRAKTTEAIRRWSATLFHEIAHVIDFTTNTILDTAKRARFDLLHAFSKTSADYAREYGSSDKYEDLATVAEEYAQDTQGLFGSQSNLLVQKALVAADMFSFKEGEEEKTYTFEIRPDGTIEAQPVKITRDEDGNIIKIDGIYDQGAAAAADAVIVHIYDMTKGIYRTVTRTNITKNIAGDISSYTDTYTDENGNTITEHTTAVEYDEDGNIISL